METLHDIRDLSRDELAALCARCGEPRYRAGQIAAWLYQKNALSFEAMSNLPKPFIERLKREFSIAAASLAATAQAPAALKYLVRLADGACIESVELAHRDWHTLCLSSQAGCRFSCSFCASGAAGFVRNLTQGEILAQLLFAQGTIKNIVFMGMGEPLDNLEHVVRAIDIIHDPACYNIGNRKITISTCAPKGGIPALLSSKRIVELSVSLHAPSDALRSRLMPVNRTHPLAAVLAECDAYTAETGRHVTFEYVLLSGVNDTPVHAAELAQLLKGRPCKINLIPVNPVEGSDFTRPRPTACAAFLTILEKQQLAATLRGEKGDTIDAACGQLRLRNLKKS